MREGTVTLFYRADGDRVDLFTTDKHGNPDSLITSGDFQAPDIDGGEIVWDDDLNIISDVSYATWLASAPTEEKLAYEQRSLRFCQEQLRLADLLEAKRKEYEEARVRHKWRMDFYASGHRKDEEAAGFAMPVPYDITFLDDEVEIAQKHLGLENVAVTRMALREIVARSFINEEVSPLRPLFVYVNESGDLSVRGDWVVEDAHSDHVDPLFELT